MWSIEPTPGAWVKTTVQVPTSKSQSTTTVARIAAEPLYPRPHTVSWLDFLMAEPPTGPGQLVSSLSISTVLTELHCNTRHLDVRARASNLARLRLAPCRLKRRASAQLKVAARTDTRGAPAWDAVSGGCNLTAVTSTRLYSCAALAAGVLATVVMLAGSGDATAAGSCPTAAAQNGGTPEWTLAGSTGSIAVTGPTDTTAPRVDVTGPFSVTQTQVHTLHAGDGPVIPATARVSVCYMGVNGRDGSVFDSSYERGAAVDFPLGGVVPGFQKAIAGQKVGSTVAVAMTSSDGYPDGQPSAGIRPGDTLVFVIKILSAQG